MLDVVVDFIDAIIPDQPFLIAGTSYGGYPSRGVLKRKFNQVAGMALICPVILGDQNQRGLPPRTVIVKNAQLLAELSPADAEAYGSMAVVQDEQNWKRFRDEPLSGIKATLIMSRAPTVLPLSGSATITCQLRLCQA